MQNKFYITTPLYYVNDEPHLYTLNTTDGIINTKAILSNGANEIKIEVIDKATNENSLTLLGIYNNIGPRTELIDPLSGDIINPISAISAKLFSENNASNQGIFAIPASLRLCVRHFWITNNF